MYIYKKKLNFTRVMVKQIKKIAIKRKINKISKRQAKGHIIFTIGIKRENNKRSRIYGNRNKWKNRKRYRF